MSDSPSRKKNLRGGKIDVHAYIDPAIFDRLYEFRDPDDGDRWESALLRKIIREWLEGQDRAVEGDIIRPRPASERARSSR